MNTFAKNIQNRFLGTFRGEMQANIVEFGKQLWEKDSDVFIFMARKAACFFDCLRELKIADVRGVAVSDRILDMDLSFLAGKTVTLVDDCVFSGTTLYHARDIVIKAGATKCDTMTLSINEDWIRPDLLPGGAESHELSFTQPLFRLDDSQCVQQCFDVVRAISILPRPYDVDFPHTLTSKLSDKDFDHLVHCSGWQPYDVSTNYQISQNVRTFTLVPDLHIQRGFMEAYSGLNSNIQASKVRLYAKKLSDKNWSVRMVPIIMLGAMQIKLIEKGEIWGDEFENVLKELGAISPKSRYRLLHYLVSWALLKQFSTLLKEQHGLQIQDKLRFDLAEMSFGSKFSTSSTKAIDLLKTVSWPLPVIESDSPTIAKFGDDIKQVENPQELVSACLEPFIWLYKNLELPARLSVKSDGLKACLDEEQNDLIRLRRGFSPRRLISRLKSNSFDVARYVSLFLDKAIDLGVAVPTVVNDGGVLYRAFRHGEDAVFGEAEERLGVIALQAYMENRGISAIYGLELQKFIVLFIQIAIRDGFLLERLNTSESVNIGCRIVSIKGHLHGPVPMVTTLDESGSVGAPFVEGNDYPAEWLINDWVRKGILSSEDSALVPLSVESIKDASKLIIRLKNKPDAVSTYVFNRLEVENRKKLDESKVSETNFDGLLPALINNLNSIIAGDLIWDEDAFKNTKIRTTTKNILNLKPTGTKLLRINRLLIEDAFPDIIVKSSGGIKYTINNVPELKIGTRKESQARKIGRCLGRVIGDKHSADSRPLNNDTDLVLLSTCSEAEHQIRALSGELSIIHDRWLPTLKQVREKAREEHYDEASNMLLGLNSLFTSINSGAMKYQWFIEQRLPGIINEVSDFTEVIDRTGDLRDDWILLWPETIPPTVSSTPPSAWSNITAMGQWLITTSVAIRVFNYWLILSAEANSQKVTRNSLKTAEDLLKWCNIFTKYCAKATSTPFGEMVRQLLNTEGKVDIQIIGNQCKLAASFINDAGRRAIRHLLSDSKLLCESYGTVGEFRPFPYAVFFDVEHTGITGDPYAKQLKLASDLLDDDARLIEHSHNPWRKGLWILLRGNRNSTKAIELCYQLIKRCNSSGLRFRAVVLGQLSYDDSIRDMEGSVKLAEGDFFRRIAELRSSVLPANYNNRVVLVNEVTTGSISEGNKFCELTKLRPISERKIDCGNDDLPHKTFLVTDVNALQFNNTKRKGQLKTMTIPANSHDNLNIVKLRNTIDIGIITIREDEFEAVLNRFPKRQFVKGTGCDYHYTEVATNKNILMRVVITRSPEQGQSAAQALASSMISDLAPKWIFVVGIAGGLPASEFTLGDVLLSQRMHDFAVSAAIEGKSPSFQDMGGPMSLEVEKLVTGLKGLREHLGDWNKEAIIGQAKPVIIPPTDISSAQLYGSDDWKQKVLDSLKHHFPEGKNIRIPDFFSAVIIASNTLVKDTTLASQWQQNARHASAVEMELGGVCRAARYGADGNTRVLAIRGLSDIVGYKRSHEWTEYACKSASAFAEALIKSGLI